jgi:hypothetical protein
MALRACAPPGGPGPARGRCPCQGQDEGRGRSGSSSGEAEPPWRPPRLSWRWKITVRSRTGSISSSGSVRRRPATTLAWPTSRQRPTAGDEIRFAIVRRIIGVNDRPVGCGIDRSQVLEGDDHPESLGPSGERQPVKQPILAGWPIRQVGGVVDDVRGADLGGVIDQTSDGTIAVTRAGPRRARAVKHGAQASGAQRIGERRRMTVRLAGMSQDRWRRGGNLDEAESGGLDLLEDWRRRPPVVGNAESEPLRRVAQWHRISKLRRDSLNPVKRL